LISTKGIDEIDATILRELLKDGRKEFSEIAKENGVSKNIISKRYKEMEKSGIIVGATTQINYGQLGYYSTAEIIFAIDSTEMEQAGEMVKKIPNAFPFISIDGRNRVTVFFYVKDLSEIENVKSIIGKKAFSQEMKTEIWTGEIRNIPENLSFGLPENCIGKVYEAQSPPIIKTMKKISEIDETDMKIIDKLSENGRSPFRIIAKDVGVTTDTIAKRYKKLKRNRTIKTVIQISPDKIGYKANLECRTVNALAKIPDVFHISVTTGSWDLHAWALIRDIEHLFATESKIAAVPDFGRMDVELNKFFLEGYPGIRQNISRI
jgi:Lrp/AsnC family transcriptional regulator for asnA, asnC and gidA